jgi:hypothetical protein
MFCHDGFFSCTPLTNESSVCLEFSPNLPVVIGLHPVIDEKEIALTAGSNFHLTVNRRAILHE